MYKLVNNILDKNYIEADNTVLEAFQDRLRTNFLERRKMVAAQIDEIAPIVALAGRAVAGAVVKKGFKKYKDRNNDETVEEMWPFRKKERIEPSMNGVKKIPMPVPAIKAPIGSQAPGTRASMDEARKKKVIKVELNPKKKIGHASWTIGPGGKKTLVGAKNWPGQKDLDEKQIDYKNYDLDIKEDVPIEARSLYAKTYAKHTKTAYDSDKASATAYAHVEKKHGAKVASALKDYHNKNREIDEDNLDEAPNTQLQIMRRLRAWRQSKKWFGDQNKNSLRKGKIIPTEMGDLDESKWNYPDHIKGPGDPEGRDGGNKKKYRKEWRKKSKALAHKELKTGQKQKKPQGYYKNIPEMYSTGAEANSASRAEKINEISDKLKSNYTYERH
jgi:hypothetical protein